MFDKPNVFVHFISNDIVMFGSWVLRKKVRFFFVVLLNLSSERNDASRLKSQYLSQCVFVFSSNLAIHNNFKYLKIYLGVNIRIFQNYNERWTLKFINSKEHQERTPQFIERNIERTISPNCQTARLVRCTSFFVLACISFEMIVDNNITES